MKSTAPSKTASRDTATCQGSCDVFRQRSVGCRTEFRCERLDKEYCSPEEFAERSICVTRRLRQGVTPTWTQYCILKDRHLLVLKGQPAKNPLRQRKICDGCEYFMEIEGIEECNYDWPPRHVKPESWELLPIPDKCVSMMEYLVLNQKEGDCD